jgi:hypothetical protein
METAVEETLAPGLQQTRKTRLRRRSDYLLLVGVCQEPTVKAALEPVLLHQMPERPVRNLQYICRTGLHTV